MKIFCVFLLAFFCALANAKQYYSIYSTEQQAMAGCRSEISSRTFGTQFKSGSCYSEFDQDKTYVARAYLCTYLTNACRNNKSDTAHFAFGVKKYGSSSSTRDQAKAECKRVAKTGSCSAENLANKYFNQPMEAAFSKCKSRSNNVYLPQYNNSVVNVCEFKFSDKPKTVNTVKVTGFTRYSEPSTQLYDSQQASVLFANNMDRTITGRISWSFPSRSNKVRLQVKVDFGPSLNINDINWEDVSDQGGVFEKSKNETSTYLRTLPEPLYGWLYNGGPNFIVREITNSRYVHIHYRIRSENNAGSSEWKYLKPITIYYPD